MKYPTKQSHPNPVKRFKARRIWRKEQNKRIASKQIELGGVK